MWERYKYGASRSNNANRFIGDLQNTEENHGIESGEFFWKIQSASAAFNALNLPSFVFLMKKEVPFLFQEMVFLSILMCDNNFFDSSYTKCCSFFLDEGS